MQNVWPPLRYCETAFRNVDIATQQNSDANVIAPHPESSEFSRKNAPPGNPRLSRLCEGFALPRDTVFGTPATQRKRLKRRFYSCILAE